MESTVDWQSDRADETALVNIIKSQIRRMIYQEQPLEHEIKYVALIRERESHQRQPS